MQFTIVLLNNLVLFPPEQPHFITAFCVGTLSIFFPFTASTFAPGELCGCWAVFRRINAEPDPPRYTPRTLTTSSQHPVKAHLLVSAPIFTVVFSS